MGGIVVLLVVMMFSAAVVANVLAKEDCCLPSVDGRMVGGVLEVGEMDGMDNIDGMDGDVGLNLLEGTGEASLFPDRMPEGLDGMVLESFMAFWNWLSEDERARTSSFELAKRAYLKGVKDWAG